MTVQKGNDMNLTELKARLSSHAAEPIRPPRIVMASVLIPLLERDGAVQVLFEQRDARILQGGEICFPGGHVEPGESPAEAAVRETAEELLLAPEQVELVAPLHIMSGHGTREIYSFLGILHDYKDTRDPTEVAGTFTLPLDRLLSEPPLTCEGKIVVDPGEDFPYHLIPGGRNYPWMATPRKFYFYPSPHGTVWGLTAEFLTVFLDLLR